MLEFFAKNSSGGRFEKLRAPRHSGVWVHGTKITRQDVHTIAEYYNLDLNIVRDVGDTHELPRIEYDKENGLYVFLRAPANSHQGSIVTRPVLCIIKSDSFILLERSGVFPSDKILNRQGADGQHNMSSLLLEVVNTIITDYEHLINATGESVKLIGSKLSSHEVTNKDFVRFVTIEDNLNEYEVNLGNILSATTHLTLNKRSILQQRDVEIIEDISLHIQQLIAAVKSHGQSVTSIRNAYSTIANNNLNIRIKTLTVLTILIALPNVIYGMYGMNIHLPFMDEPWIYSAVVGFSFALILVIYLVAKRFKIF